ncbi:NAD(P)/FAD-dependent oxidoreductase [Dyadobacter sp. CY312]|uniref:NAD(P)/FAD-dependent oxidoreductase n=1 Tax=Dyadobacter sp. CY312 TaxID=2907303 RepID=UPI001F2E2288|nr:NAD(P)/FAD-dependent oxidoreductase [Dyadobacter sp. CY312]MCE7042718.1 NAD(P)/FAD-dependent oxidoreductase [Dyadobacter sp. CY312]
MTISKFDVIIVGGNYAGLAAGMALGRALKTVLIIDSGYPCNRQTPYSHNFLTQDGQSPSEILALAKQQLQKYHTVSFFNGLADAAIKNTDGFELQLTSGEKFKAKKLIFATGIRDIMANVEGFDECWGITALHCPYCHGYEVKNENTGILGNGDSAYDLARLISNWSDKLTLFTNGPSTLTTTQTIQLKKRSIELTEKPLQKLNHINGNLQDIAFEDGTKAFISVIYAPVPFSQHCHIPESLGCQLTEDGYLKIDAFQQTTVEGVFACGDNVTRMRTVANAVAMGTAAGMAASKKMILEEFDSL